jgi:hypothetical protein
MSPKKKKTAKDKKIKKEKNLKEPPAEKLFTPDWPPSSLQSSNTLEKVSHPATSSDTSQLTLLQKESGGTVRRGPSGSCAILKIYHWDGQTLYCFKA